MVYKILVKSNIYVAIMITCLSAYYQLLFADYLDKNMLGFTFFATWFFYRLSRLNISQLNKNKIELLVLLFCLIGISYYAIEANFKYSVLLILSILSLMGYLYLYPLFSISLRTIPYLKSFVIAFVVSAFVVAINFYQLIQEENSYPHILIFFSAYFFLLGIAILFDVPDTKYDRAIKLKTIPNTLGINATKLIVILCFFISFILYNNITLFLKPQINLAFHGTLLFTTFLILFINEQTKPCFYAIFLETCLALPLLIWYIVIR